MPIFLAGLLGGLIQAAASLTGRVLLALGIGYVAYSGMDVLLDTLQGQVQAYIGGAPSDVLAILSLLKVDSSVSIIFSAYAARLVIGGLTSGTVKRMVIK